MNEVEQALRAVKTAYVAVTIATLVVIVLVGVMLIGKCP